MYPLDECLWYSSSLSISLSLSLTLSLAKEQEEEEEFWGEKIHASMSLKHTKRVQCVGSHEFNIKKRTRVNVQRWTFERKRIVFTNTHIQIHHYMYREFSDKTNWKKTVNQLLPAGEAIQKNLIGKTGENKKRERKRKKRTLQLCQ